MATFYSDTSQTLLEPVLWLPQNGATAGPTGRPPNSYAFLMDDSAILVDAVFSWTLPGIEKLAAEGKPPAAFVLTHAHVAEAADALEDLRRAFDAPFLLHPDDAAMVAADTTGLRFVDPRQHDALMKAGLDVIPMPYHTPGSIMLHTPKYNGILFTGDSAVTPGPNQPADPPRVERPQMATEEADKAFREAWSVLVTLRFMNSVLPYHGTPYVQRADIKMLMNIVSAGPPMNFQTPAPDDAEGTMVAPGVA